MCIYDELPAGGMLVGCNGFIVDPDFRIQHPRGIFEHCPWCGGLIAQRDLDMQEAGAYADYVNTAVDMRGDDCGW